MKNGSTNLFNVDTSTSTVTIGVSDTTAAVLVLDTKTSSGDPTAVAAVACITTQTQENYVVHRVKDCGDCADTTERMHNLIIAGERPHQWPVAVSLFRRARFRRLTY